MVLGDSLIPSSKNSGICGISIRSGVPTGSGNSGYLPCIDCCISNYSAVQEASLIWLL